MLHVGAPPMALGTFLFQFNLRETWTGSDSVITSSPFLRTLVVLRSHLQGRLRTLLSAIKCELHRSFDEGQQRDNRDSSNSRP